RVSARLNESAGTAVARAHHGSINHELRRAIEEDLKAGRLPAVVATSSLELGIDMGDVDLVVQIESPPSVASGLQRIGRAGHQVGAVSRGVLLPRWRGDLVECAVVVERMRNGEIEPLRYPRNPLDVLAQHVVSMAAMDEWTVAALGELVRGAAPFATLPQPALESVLDMLSGRYPSDEFAELRPRLNWDRVSNVLSGRSNAQRLAVTGGGTIPDRGLFGVFLVGGAEGDSPWIRSGQKQTRVGELDEEMVYESRRGDVIVLGASSWRIEDITHDRVLVTPAPGVSGKTPFWHGDAPGRPLALGRAHGAFLREIGDDRARLLNAGLDERAADSLLGYLAEQRAAVSVLPDDRTIVMERFPDAVGDWRVCIHSPFGAQVHAPWAMAIAARIHQQLGVDVQTMHTDDGIIVRLPESDTTPAADLMLFDPDEIEPLVTAHLGGSSLFASRFRECAGRALLLGRRQPGKRTPLWQQRQKSASLLQVAAGYGSFPIVLETMRECLQDVFDVPGLRGLMADIRARAVRVVVVQTERASPFASALLFNYLGAFIYEGDAPLAERRAQALSIDTALLSELMGQAELREILNADAMHEVEASLQKRTPERRLRDADDVHDALRVLGDLSTAEIESRGDGLEQGASGSEQPVSTGLIAGAWPVLERQRRIIPVRVAGEARWIAVEDAGRYRDALGVPLPGWVPAVFLEPVPTAVRDLVARYARTHGPFVPADVARRLGLSTTAVGDALHALERAGKVVRGEFRPGGQGVEWCDQDVLRALRRRSLARLRKEVEAVPRQVLARFLPAWQGVGARGADAVLRAVVQLQGAPLPASALETLILPARAADYHPAMLDDLCASGDVVWAGAGEGWISLYLAEDVALLRPPPAAEALSESARQAAAALQDAGALFFRQIAERVHAVVDTKLLEALWDLVWAGLVTNDTIHCLRAWLGAPLAPG
ncbi:MAG: DEAD/DEAH box helicase, partial [Armatimonadetes bacterium]|nr:DEAD/DEAH box helicase [Armatimonadota bacterium]